MQKLVDTAKEISAIPNRFFLPPPTREEFESGIKKTWTPPATFEEFKLVLNLWRKWRKENFLLRCSQHVISEALRGNVWPKNGFLYPFTTEEKAAIRSLLIPSGSPILYDNPFIHGDYQDYNRTEARERGTSSRIGQTPENVIPGIIHDIKYWVNDIPHLYEWIEFIENLSKDFSVPEYRILPFTGEKTTEIYNTIREKRRKYAS